MTDKAKPTQELGPARSSFKDGESAINTNDCVSPDGVWHPRHLLAVPDRVTFGAFAPMHTYRNVTQLHTKDITPMAGGLFAGGTQAMLRYCHLHQEVKSWPSLLYLAAPLYLHQLVETCTSSTCTLLHYCYLYQQAKTIV